MVLPLISPVGSNFIKDFPAQNAVNLDAIDSYAGPSLITHPLTAYTPILHARDAGPDPVLGTGGVIQGFYYRIFDLIYTWGEFRFGTAGTSFGTGVYTITIPFPADDGIVSANATSARGAVVGDGLLWDDSTDGGKRQLIAQLRTNTEVQFQVGNGVGGGFELVNSGGPITWAINDGMSWWLTYKRLP